MGCLRASSTIQHAAQLEEKLHSEEIQEQCHVPQRHYGYPGAKYQQRRVNLSAQEDLGQGQNVLTPGNVSAQGG